MIYVDSIDKLPKLKGKELFLDFETTSRNPKEKSTNPHTFCWVAGIALSSDNSTDIYYVPLDHQEPYQGFNLPRDVVVEWLKEVLDNHEEWINHNVKYDAHCAKNDLGLDFKGAFICTLQQAKIFDSDRQYTGGYGLDVLSRQLCGYNIDDVGQALLPYLIKNKDYGRIHPHVLGKYACEDIEANRRLYRFLQANIPEECSRIVDLEKRVTRALFNVEQNGMRIKPVDVLVEDIRVLVEMEKIRLYFVEKYDKYYNPSSSKDMQELFHGVWRLPVAVWNENDEGERTGPSFNKAALLAYAAMQNAPKDELEMIGKFRELKTYHSLFIVKYSSLHRGGLLHPNYNQTVATGRMSCSDPNMQQLSKLAKLLICPLEEDHYLMSFDYSQIEFREIIHYIEDHEAIEAFKQNPDTDFHDYVTAMCRVERNAGKMLNFQTAFGGGKQKMIDSLSALKSTYKLCFEKLNVDPEFLAADTVVREHMLNKMIEEYALHCYNTYHARFNTLKKTANECAKICKQRGYVRTLMGRRRHFRDPNHSYKAFNAVNQGSAADIIKEKLAIFDELLAGTPIKIVAIVHDELLFSVPKHLALDPRTARDIGGLMEELTVPLTVPLRVSYQMSAKSWYNCEFEEDMVDENGKDVKKKKLNVEFGNKGERFAWLKQQST